MADSIKQVNYLRYFHTSEASLKDKDILKNDAYLTNEARIKRVMLVPFAAQIWQLSLINQPEMMSLYRRVRVVSRCAAPSHPRHPSHPSHPSCAGTTGSPTCAA